MNKTESISVIGAGILTLLVLAAVVSAFTPSGKVVQQAITRQGASAVQNGDVQVVQLSYKDLNYYPSTIYLKAGVPARIEVDTEKVTGCMRTIVIPSLNIKKTVSASDNVIEFTPTKEGTIPFSCIMGMGRGTFIVTQDGTATTASTDSVKQAQQNNNAPAATGSCGAGGCGCGAR